MDVLCSLELLSAKVQPEAVGDGDPLGLCHLLQSLRGRTLRQHAFLKQVVNKTSLTVVEAASGQMQVAKSSISHLSDVEA